MKGVQKTAFCGVLCAIAVVFMLLTVFPYATISLAVLAGIALIPAALELGTGYGLVCYVVAAVLACIIAPDPEAKVLFVSFFGFYPIIQLRLNLWYRRAAAWGIKLLLFNAATVTAFLILSKVIGLSEEFSVSGVWIPLLLGNLVFVIYDIALTRVTAFYRVRLHPLVRKLFR